MTVGVSTFPDTGWVSAVRLALFVLVGLALGVSGCAKRTLISPPPPTQAEERAARCLATGRGPAGRATGHPPGQQGGLPGSPIRPAPGGRPSPAQCRPQLALFDIADDRFELVVRDTRGTPDGARAAAQEALAEGASLVLGPLFATSVTAAAPATRGAGINMVAFSNDVSVAGSGVYLLGILPQTQVARVAGYASRSGLRRFGLLAPSTPFGQVVARSFQDTVARNGAEVANIQFYAPSTTDLSDDVRQFSRAARYDAMMAPAGGGELQQIAALLPFYDIDPARVRYLGTVLWDNPGVMTEPSLQGSWIAAPAPAPRESFAIRYRDTFGSTPAARGLVGIRCGGPGSGFDARHRCRFGGPGGGPR